MKFELYIIKWKKLARPNVSNGWRIRQDQMLRDHILTHLSGELLTEITPLHVAEIINASREKGHSPSMTLQIYLLLSKVFSDAIDLFGILNQSPIRRRLHKPKVIRIEQKHMTNELAKSFVRYSRSEKKWGLPIRIQIFCGLRVSELQGLKGRDFDRENRCFHVRRAWNRPTKTMLDYPKGRRQFIIPIPDELFNELELLNVSDEDFICTQRGGKRGGVKGKMLSYNSYYRAVKRITKSFAKESMSTHSMRHSTSGIWGAVGATIKDLAQLFNHSHESVTERYIHGADSRLVEISKNVNSKKSKAA